jgi:hypothetical protein
MGLDFVRGLRPGDSLPSEVLTGEPSWDITEEHRKVASQRLTMQLVTWLTGKEVVCSEPGSLQELTSAPETAERIRRALREASDQLGLEDGEGEVVNRIERLVEELAYVEALREMFQDVRAIKEECDEILRDHARETSIVDLATPVLRLIERAVADFESSFRRIDEQTSEIVPSIRDVDEHCASLSAERNALYVRLRPWHDVLDLWSAGNGGETPFGIADLLRATYRFLAPRYMEFYEWVLATKPPPSDAGPRPQRDLMRPRRRRYGGVMRW